MGRRKSNRKPAPKKKLLQPLEKVFTCPFCNHEKSCDVKMELEKNTAYIKCNVCSEDFQTVINCNYSEV
jgi:transcription elongation factor Elf1